MQWLTTNAEILTKIFGAVGAVAGGVVLFYKLIKYVAKSRKRTDEKLDGISKTLTEQHSKDFQEVKSTLSEFKGAIDLCTQQVANLNDRADRVDKNVETVTKTLLDFKGSIESNIGIAERNSDRLEDVEDTVRDHESRIIVLEVKPTSARSRVTTKRKTKRKAKKKN